MHLAVSVPPTFTISEWVGQLKGASSHYINHRSANSLASAIAT
ncbi:MAG: transposase [Candidatus Brocadiae bacterium]|nr:transposase [Candidatus Brocadiia bacterium]